MEKYTIPGGTPYNGLYGEAPPDGKRYLSQTNTWFIEVFKGFSYSGEQCGKSRSVGI